MPIDHYPIKVLWFAMAVSAILIAIKFVNCVADSAIQGRPNWQPLKCKA